MVCFNIQNVIKNTNLSDSGDTEILVISLKNLMLMNLSGLVIKNVLKSCAGWKLSKYVPATPRLQ